MPSYKSIDEEELLIGCSCHSKNHLVSFAISENSLDRKTGDDIPDDFFFSIGINNYLGIFKRLFIAFKYVFSPLKINRTGDFAEVLCSPEDVLQLKDFCNKYLSRNKKYLKK